MHFVKSDFWEEEQFYAEVIVNVAVSIGVAAAAW